MLQFANYGFASPKHLKGPWTHSPQKKLVAKALDHLQVCRTLLQKVRCVASGVLDMYLIGQ